MRGSSWLDGMDGGISGCRASLSEAEARAVIAGFGQGVSGRIFFSRSANASSPTPGIEENGHR
jgi:hypothetical protein